MQLQENEEMLWQDQSIGIELTNIRFRFTQKGTTRIVQSVLLRQILQCSYRRTHKFWLLAIAVLSLITGFSRDWPRPMYAGCFALALVLGAIYIMTLKMILVVETTSQPITIPINRHSSAYAEEIIEAIELALVETSATSEIPQTRMMWPAA